MDRVPARLRERRGAELPVIAWGAVAPAMAALAVVLTVFSNAYGFHRDELYFRMLPPGWGYVDEPPLVPLLARLTGHISSSPWAMRIPATLAATLSVLVLVLITRELGGGRPAQTLCAWAYAFAATPLAFGHLLATTTVDLVVWPLTCLFVMRALLRREPRWWVWAGAVVGLSTYNKLLVALLVIALAVGVLLVGPREVFRSRWLGAAVLVAAVLAVPNVLYQMTHSWPQLTMARALRNNNAADVRVQMWPYLVVLLGPPLVPIWVAGLVSLWRRAQWRPVRFFVPALGVLLLETFVGGGQFYYPIGLLAVVFAAGCVPAAEFLARSRPWRVAAIVSIAVNACVSAVIGLPVLPVSVLPDSPVPDINMAVGDQIGWPEYVDQVAAVYRRVPAAELPRTVIFASNYGEAGALVHYGPAAGLPRPYSAQNQLYFDARPADSTTTVVVVGGELSTVGEHFRSCTVLATLHNDSGVDNEEQGQPVAVCRQPLEDWPTIWRALLHYD
jgi:4-amino-4-deoxy-L-arabinose transferase-like glycosyltransferase